MSAPFTRATWADCRAENARLSARIQNVEANSRILQRGLKRADAECDEFRDISRLYLDEIKALHLDYERRDCEDCDGKGECEEVVVCDSPSLSDSMQPAEKAEMVVCGRCHGTSKEWLT